MMMDGSEGAWEDALEALDFPVDPLTGMRVWSEEALHAMGGVALGKIDSSGGGTGEAAETRRLACVLAGIVKIVRRREGDGIIVLSVRYVYRRRFGISMTCDDPDVHECASILHCHVIKNRVPPESTVHACRRAGPLGPDARRGASRRSGDGEGY